MAKFKKDWLKNSDTIFFLCVLVVSILITLAELAQISTATVTFAQARADNALWIVIPSLCICPAYCIIVPVFLIKNYKKWK